MPRIVICGAGWGSVGVGGRVKGWWLEVVACELPEGT